MSCEVWSNRNIEASFLGVGAFLASIKFLRDERGGSSMAVTGFLAPMGRDTGTGTTWV